MNWVCAIRARCLRHAALILVVIWAIVACQPREDSAPVPREEPSPAMPAIALSEADAGKTVDVERGQEIVVRLSSNRTTGYGWTLASSGAGILASTGDAVYMLDSTATNMAGAGGVESWSFKANQSGQEELRFEYRRPWEQTTAPAKTVSFTIRVR